MKWLDRVLGRKVFSPLEERLLRDLQQHLTADAAKILAEQLRRINLAQRHSKGREVNFYPMRRGRPERDATVGFPATDPELKLATVDFEVPGEGRFTAEFHIVEGHFFSLEFTPSPSRIENRSDDVVVHRIQIHRDPMTPPPSADRPSAAGPGQIDAQLPSDYLETAERTGAPGVSVLSPAEVYSIVLEDATYYVLAQVTDSGVLAVRKHSSDSTVYFLPFDGAPRALGTSFREAVTASRGQALAADS